MILVDTSAWYALAIRSDPNHAPARTWYRANRERLRNEGAVVTDYILDETFTLFWARRRRSAGLILGRRFFPQTLARIEWVTEADVRNAWDTFQQNAWSFTDCVSFVVMQRLGINTAFAIDRHFRQFPGMTVVP